MELYLRWKNIIDEDIKVNRILKDDKRVKDLYSLKLELMEDFYKNNKITISSKLEDQLL